MASPEMLAKLAELKAARAKAQDTEAKDTETKKEVAPEDKTCRSCLHLFGKRTNVETAADDWQCHHSSNVHIAPKDMVTGIQRTEYEFSIYTYRNQFCKGDWYEEYVMPAYLPLPTPSTRPAPASTSKARLSVSLNDI